MTLYVLLQVCNGHCVRLREFTFTHFGWFTYFLPRDSMRKRGLCCASDVRQSVRPSVMYVYCIQTETAEDIVKLLSRPGTHIILIFTLCAGTQFQGNPFSRLVRYTGGGKNLRFSTEIAVYLRNGMR